MSKGVLLGAAILAVVLSGATISLVTPLAFGMSQLTQQSPDVEYYLVRWDLAGDPGRIGIHLTVDTRVTVGVPTLGEAAYVQECCGVTASTHTGMGIFHQHIGTTLHLTVEEPHSIYHALTIIQSGDLVHER